MMKRLILGLFGLILSLAPVHAQKTPPVVPVPGTVTPQSWVAYDRTFSGITLACGHPFHFNVLPPPSYDPTNHIYPLYIWFHPDHQGDPWYLGQNTDPLFLTNDEVGSYNTGAWLKQYPAFYVAPYADQTNGNGSTNSCSSQGNDAVLNWGGWFNNGTVGSGTHYSGDTGPNTFAVIQMIQFLEATYSIDPNRIIINGFSLGGIYTDYACLHYNAYTGDLGRYFAACAGSAGVNEANAPPNSTIANTMRNVPQWMFSGTGDNQSPPNDWNSPLCSLLGGNPSALTGITSATANQCGTSAMRYTLCPSCGHQDTDASGAAVWTNFAINNFLFAQTAGTSPGGPSPPCVKNCDVLPSGYLTVAGNQVRDGSGNNVRLACTAYDRPTASVSADLISMRNQGFNCARVPWFDKVTCPSGTCNFAAFDAIVAAATTNSMKVVFDHQANEGTNGAGACTTQQANGLWYDLNGTAPWNVTNGTDGCGTAGTVTYTQFKANWVSFAAHYTGNATVLGFDLHNEPTTFGNPACCATGGGGGGQFSIANGAMTDPSGQPFIPVGVNVYGDPGGLAAAAQNSAGFPILSIYPKLNFIRVIVGPLSHSNTQWTYQAPNDPSFVSIVNNLTAHGVVVEFEDHSSNGGFWENGVPGGLGGTVAAPPTGTSLAQNTAFWASMATQFKGNPYVWFGDLNELCSVGCSYDPSAIAPMSTYQLALYNAIRATGNTSIIELGAGVGNGNPGTTGLGSGLIAADYAGMHNVIWHMHMYLSGTDASVLAQVQGSTVAPCCGGGGSQGYLGAQTIGSADGVMPVIIDECGSGTTADPQSTSGQQIANALRTSQSANLGSACFVYYQPNGVSDWQMVNNAGTSGLPLSSYAFTPWGSIYAANMAANPKRGATTWTPGGGSTIGANWGTGNGGDMKAMVEDVGAAVHSANPGALIMVEGVFNNSNLFNGTTRGSTAFPITAGSIGDLSTIGTLPVACCGGKVLYSIHDLPTDLSGVAPDAGAAATTMRNTAWGYLEKNNAAPVWVGKLGASLDNSNGQVSDETAWASGLTQYMNGQLGSQGGPTFTGCQQPIGGDWFDWGNNASQQPNGTVNPDGSYKSGQQTYWASLLYTICTGGGPTPGAGATTWNPADASSGVTLTGTNLIATTIVTGSQSVRSTTSQTTGKTCFAVVANTISPNWDVGIANSSYGLTVGGGLGSDSNGIGFDPRSAGGMQGIFYNNAVLSSGTGTSPNGEEELICADLTAKLFWATNATMRGNGNPWNNSPTANPATGVGGLPFAGLPCPCFITWNEDEAGVATLNATGPFAVSVPTGFLAWQQPVTSGGHPMVLIFGANENKREPANDNRVIAFAQLMDLTR